MEEEKSKAAKTLPAQLTSIMIANALDSPAAHTSFGKLPLADEKSAPVFSFGTGTRDQLQKVFYSEELNGQPCKNGPGPKYEVKDNVNFKTLPNFSFGKDKRVTLGKSQHYYHYDIQDTFTDPIKSKIYTKTSYGNTKFGTESRMPPPEIQGTPGPQYYPPLRPEVKTAPKYTLGARRVNPNGSVLQNQVSTPGIVGPGRYAPESSSYTSVHKDPPTWTFGNSEKIGKTAKSVTRHQTYDTHSVACGPQISSKKKSAPNPKIGTASRDQVAKLGTFKDMMATQPMKVRLPHPSF
ncbi:unnamed protein product [Blepharisma stoltei]|uniref:Uncharacterized protein n=1 Tax=Blepharisma stoltei TaxID=1481888 RepID=A0AAU9KCF5_9CILI|nr:unnamed protein product [Blepharisma stoltei]